MSNGKTEKTKRYAKLPFEETVLVHNYGTETYHGGHVMHFHKGTAGVFHPEQADYLTRTFPTWFNQIDHSDVDAKALAEAKRNYEADGYGTMFSYVDGSETEAEGAPQGRIKPSAKKGGNKGSVTLIED